MAAPLKIVPDIAAGEQPAPQPRAFHRLLAEMRPYLDYREAARALCTGSAAFTGRVWLWVTAKDWKTAGRRFGCLAAGGYGAAWMCGHHPAVAMPVLVGAWCLAALVHAPDACPTAQRVADDKPTEHSLEDIRAALLALLDDLTRGRNGIHLDQLHAHLTQDPALAGLPRAAIGPWLREHGVPVTRSLSVGGIEGRSGVRRTDIEALLNSPRPEAALGHSQPTKSSPDLRESRPALGLLTGRSRRALGDVEQPDALQETGA